MKHNLKDVVVTTPEYRCIAMRIKEDYGKVLFEEGLTLDRYRDEVLIKSNVEYFFRFSSTVRFFVNKIPKELWDEYTVPLYYGLLKEPELTRIKATHIMSAILHERLYDDVLYQPTEQKGIP